MAKGDAAEVAFRLIGSVAKKIRGGRGARSGAKVVDDVTKRVTSRLAPRRPPRKPTTPEMAERYFLRPEGYKPPTRPAAKATPRGPRAPKTQRVLFGKDYPTMGAGRKTWQATKRVGPLATLSTLGLLSMDKLPGQREKGYSFDPGTGTTTFTDAAGNIFAVDPTTGAQTKIGTDPQPAALSQMSEDWLQAQLGNYPGAEGELTYGEEGMGAAGDYGFGSDYSDLRASANRLAQNLRGYGTAKGTGMRNIYGQLSTEAAQDAIKAEAIARAAYEDIGRIGRDYSAGATADITSPGAGGPTELTGLTPVTGESYDIPGRIADTSQIAADYVLRDLNLTRDDLNYMSGMAKMMGPAYEAQLNDSINLAIANKMFELDQYIAEQQGTDRRFAAEQAALDRRFAMEQQALTQRERDAASRQAWADFYERESARQGILGGTSQLSSDQYIIYLTAFEDLNKDEKGRQTLRGLGINPDDPNAFQKFLAREQRIAAGQVAGS